MNEIAETSQTTEGSTPSSTTPSTGDSTGLAEPVQTLEVPELNLSIEVKTEGKIDKNGNASVEVSVEQKYHCKKWQYDELKKAINHRMRKTISVQYSLLKHGKSELQKKTALDFFHREFPGRSPYAVYHKSYYLQRRGVTTIVLLRRHE